MSVNLTRAIAVVNHKGGVGKSSVSANLAGLLALNGARILLVDLDPQGNQRVILGYRGTRNDDSGWGVVQAVYAAEPFTVLRDIRPGLDVIPGGGKLDALTAISYTPAAAELPGGGVPAAFATELNTLAGEYDFVILDCPPRITLLQEAALRAARYVLIPSTTDAMAWDGITGVGPLVRKTRETNPALTYLGVVIFKSATAATRTRATARATLAELGETVPVFDTFIRHSETAAADASMHGQLAHEVARDAASLTAQRLRALRARKPGEPVNVPSPARAASSLADDYRHLLAEILTRISHTETTAAQQALP